MGRAVPAAAFGRPVILDEDPNRLLLLLPKEDDEPNEFIEEKGDMIHLCVVGGAA